MKSLMVRGLVSVVIGGLVLCGARVASASTTCPRAELHYAIASQLEAEGMSAEPIADAAYEDAWAQCEREYEAGESALELLDRETFAACDNTGITRIPGGWVATCWDAEGNELFSVEPDASELGQ